MQMRPIFTSITVSRYVVVNVALVRHLAAGTRPIKCHLLPLQVAFYDLLFFMPL
jgi:hypothetical protein